VSYLMDTHVLLWFLAGDARLSGRAKRVIQGETRIYFSPVSLWEIGIKLGLKKKQFQLAGDWWQSMPRALVQQGIERLDLRPENFRDVALLPLHHRDPFDRMLIVQAKEASIKVISADAKLVKYDVEVVW